MFHSSRMKPMALAVATTFAGAAIAQDSDDPPVASPMIEEVVVTAQKRAENLQDVPIAITALTEDAIEDRGIKSMEDLFTSTPGVVGFEAPSTRGNIGVNIRGIGSGNSNNISIDPANAIYVDGVYLGKATGLGVDSGDLARVEIVRGPQGTLYGRNSTGGAINFITRQPAGELGFEGKVSAGNEGLEEYRFRIDLPMVANVSTAFSLQSRERDHLYRNTNPDSRDFENLDRFGYRFALDWEPTDNFRLNYRYDNSEIDEQTQALDVVGMNPIGAGVLDEPGFPTNTSIRSRDRRGLIAQTQQFLPFLGPAFQTPQVQQLNQWMTDYLNWFDDQVAPTGRQFTGSTDGMHTSSNEVEGHSLTLALDRYDVGFLGDVEFKSITGFRTVDNRNQADLDGQDNTVRPLGNGLTSGVISDQTLLTISGLFFDSLSPNLPAALEFATGQALVDAINQRGRAETFNTFITADYEQFSQELQMVGSTDRVDYAVGLFYFDDEGERRGNSTAVFPIASTTSTAFDNATTAKSVYGQFTFRPTVESPWSFTAGLRYTQEDKDITYLWRSTANPFGFFGPVLAGQSPAVTYTDDALADTQPPVLGIFGRSFSEDFSNTSGKLTVAYDISDSANVFATYSTGYRSGGFNGDAFDSVNDTADAFNEETIENFEIGVKSDLLDGRMRLNATYFDYTYDDLQVSTLLASADGSVTSNTDNAGSADRKGIELEFTWLPLDDLALTLNLTSIDGDFSEYPPVIVSDLGGGAVLPTSDLAVRNNVPDNQLAFNVDYTIAYTDYGVWNFNLNGIWQEATLPIAINTATYDTNGDRIADTPIVFEQLQNDERTMVNARLALNEIPVGQGTLNIGLWARNLLDDDHRVFSFNYGSALGLNLAQYGEPRTYGLDVVYRF